MDALNTIDTEINQNTLTSTLEAEIIKFAEVADGYLGIAKYADAPAPIFAGEQVPLVPDITGFNSDPAKAERLRVASVKKVFTHDHVSSLDPAVFEASNSLLRALACFADGNGETRSKGKIVDLENRNESTKILAQLPVLDRWLQTIPSAFALEPLYDSRHIARLSEPFGELDDQNKRNYLYAQMLIENCLDGVGIRSRGAVTQQAISEVAEAFGKEEPIRILSLAAGAGVSVFREAANLRANGYEVELVLVDSDPAVLQLARQNAEVLGLVEGHDITLVEMDIMNEQEMDAELKGQMFHVVEAIGIEEYFPKRLASRLVSIMARRVKQGGEAIFANMTDSDTRQDLNFTLKVVDWPYIRPRAAKEVVDIVSAAGIDTASKLEIVETADRLYNLYRIKL